MNEDDETRRLLHDADPARSLPPTDPMRVAALLEDTMDQPQQPARRTPRYVLVGVAAAAAVAAAVTIGVGNSDDDPAPQAKDPGTSRTTPAPGGDTGEETTTELTSGPAAAAKCAMPEPRFVAQQQVAFEGTVVSVADGVVTLEPSKFWTGTETDLVEVAEPDLGMSEGPVDFQVGSDYVVGATDGQVSICGLSGLATDDLRALYDEAFGK